MMAADSRVFLSWQTQNRSFSHCGFPIKIVHNFNIQPSRVLVRSSNQSELRNADGSDTIYGFQCNERFLKWDESAARQLIRIYLAEQLDTDLDYVNVKLTELGAACPDMVDKLDKMKATLVLSLVKDTEKVAKRMIALTNALPGINVSRMVSSNVWLLSEPLTEILASKLEDFRYFLRVLLIVDVVYFF